MTADPTAGEPRAITKLSGAVADRQDDVRRGARLVADAEQEATGWEGASKDRFSTTVGTVPAAARRVLGRLDVAIDVLGTYAHVVRQIQDDADRVRAAQAVNEVDGAAVLVALAGATAAAGAIDSTEADGVRARLLQADADDLAAQAKRLGAEWDALVERRSTADRTAVAGLSGSDVLGVATSYAGTLRRMSDDDFLAAVAATAPEVLAAQRASVGARLAGMSPEDVQAWWDGLGGRGSAKGHAAARDTLITGLPGVIGNLDGVPYWARDRANRIAAQRAEAVALAELARVREAIRSSRGGPDGPRLEVALADAQERYEALRDFTAAARPDLNLLAPLPRQMVSFHPGEPPLGAFAVGDLDAAKSVSFLVPGMGSSLQDTTHYMRAGSNVQAHQQNVRASPTAMVTWLGYEPPPYARTGDLSVLGDGHAVRGADRFAADLLGMRATRPDVTIDVVAHSYGSTMASVALTIEPDIRVRSFVTLGSAGIPAMVPDAAATHAERMYAAQADERGDVAWLGRTFSFPHRADPTQEFGATVIDTTGTRAVNVHDLSAPSGSGDRGYLDPGTPTLHATAAVTLP